jgi:hypothetical protein
LKTKSKQERSRRKKRSGEEKPLKKKPRSKKQDWLPSELKLKLLRPGRGNCNVNWMPSMTTTLQTRRINKLRLKPPHRRSAVRSSRGRRSRHPRHQSLLLSHRFLK